MRSWLARHAVVRAVVMAVVTLLAAGSLAGCGGDASLPRAGDVGLRDGGRGDAGDPGTRDSDGDGLCDDTEVEAGSDPERSDSDGDGLPDMIELIYGFGLTDPRSPAEGQVVRLGAEPGAEASLTVRFTVDGDGGDYAGYFEDSAAPYDDGSSAGLYLQGSQALHAEPPEAVRVVEPERQLFRAVLGSTRLELVVRFRAGAEVDPESCARAYPFRYGIRRGNLAVDSRRYLLVVAPADAAPEDFCTSASCI